MAEEPPEEGPGVALRTASGRVAVVEAPGTAGGTASPEDGSLRMEALEVEQKRLAPGAGAHGSLTSVRLADVVAAGVCHAAAGGIWSTNWGRGGRITGVRAFRPPIG